MRFLVDAPLSPQTAAWLTTQGHDAVHVEALGLLRAPDDVILERATREQRLVITMDLDFPELVATHRLSTPGVILVRLSTTTPARMHERLDALLRATRPDTLTNAVAVLEDARFRLRPLPIA